ncbi:sensor histidine kinase [Myceligenerans xiligouense]|uniref:histidine kinase n=1 Tax=Myceligenerans xiligouense TaxID=253184 RepID=A0A3N4YM81_9MICO|nr:histidine kinase [Myceligenerans xiligouense]RPF22199.1 signal transduction histidine kinase [Myceligenerans xiligouense]
MDRTRERRFPVVMRALTRTDADTVSPARRAEVWLWTIVSVGTVVLIAVGWPVTASGYGTHPLAAMVGTLVHCSAVALSVRWPWAGLGASIAGAMILIPITAQAAPEWPWPWPVTVLLAHCLTVFVLALRHSWFWAASLWSAGAMLTVLAPAVVDHPADDAVLANGAVLLSVSGAFALVGLLVRLWIAGVGRVEEAQRLSASEVARRRELEERNRIARELHDVVAHSMSVITVQATTAGYRRPGLDDGVQQEFEEIAASSRRALGEMRGLLGILRGHDTAPTAPLPSLPDVAGLVDSTRASGVEIAYSGTDAGVPDAIGLTAFRVVQEALSNALRHAPGSSVVVTISDDEHDLIVRIANSAPERAGEPAPGARLGLAGIRERVGAVRGTVTAGVTPDGGFELTAVVPLVEDEDALPT